MHRSAALTVVALALLLRVGADYAPYTFLYADGTFYANVNRSVTENGTFRQDELTARSWYYDDLGWNRTLTQDWSNVALGTDEELFPKHPVLMPLVAEPFYLALGLDGLLVFNVLMLVLAAGLALALLDPEGRRPFVAVAVAVTCLSPVVLKWAYGYSNDVFAAVPLLGGALALARGRPLLAGALLAGSIWARPVHALLVVVIAAPWGVAQVRARSWAALGRLAAGMAGVLAVPAALQWAWFGSPFVTGYDRILVRDRGVLALDSARAAFVWPGWADVRRVLLEDDQAFLRGFPLLALAPLGWVAQWARGRRSEAVASAVALGGATVIYAGYAYPSSRFLIPFVAFLASPLGALFEALAEAAGAARGVLARRLSATMRWIAWGAAGATALVLVGVALRWAAPRADGARLAATRVVSLDGRPCDFWNLKWQRWECSHLDRDERDMVGVPLAGECELPGEGWVRVPGAGPFTGKALEVARPGGATALEWAVAADPSARPRASVEVVVRGGGAEARVHVEPRAAPVVRRAALAPEAKAVRFDVIADVGATSRAGLCLRWVWR